MARLKSIETQVEISRIDVEYLEDNDMGRVLRLVLIGPNTRIQTEPLAVQEGQTLSYHLEDDLLIDLRTKE